MKQSFLQACLNEERLGKVRPFAVPFDKIIHTFDLDNMERYNFDDAYDDVIKTLFRMGELYGRRKQTQVYLSEPNHRANGTSQHQKMSDSAGVIAMKYKTFLGKNGFSLAIKPKVFSQPDVVSHPMAFGLHGFHDGHETLYIDKLMMPAFDEFKRHRGVRSIPLTAECLNYAENYVDLCMKQLDAKAPILMYENLRNSAPDNLLRALSGQHVGAITPEVLI